MRTGVFVWAGACFVVSLLLVIFAGRIGAARAAGWLVALGVFLVATEEPLLTTWLALARPEADRDGMATLVTPMAQAHVVGAGVFGAATASVLIGVALTALRRGEPWSKRLLSWALAIAATTEVGTSVFLFSRGLPLPGPGGAAGANGFGWQPIAVGLFAWAAGLWLMTSAGLGVARKPPRR